MIGEKIWLLTVFVLISSIVFSFSICAENNGLEENSSEKITEFTGILTFILFGLATLILPLTYVHKSIKKNAKKDTRAIIIFRSFKPAFKSSHLIIGVGALGFISLHAYLALENWNIFLTIGLMMVWTNILPGFLYYSKFFDEDVSNNLYKIHVSIIFRILIIVVLYVGHVYEV